MVERTVVVENATGLHARPGAVFAKAAAAFACKISLASGAREVDGKSILGILSLGVTKGTQVTLKADGPDAEAAVAHLAALIATNFGEA